MLLSPVQNTAKLKQNWIQVRPRITQLFGKNPQIYNQFGILAHNGVDVGPNGDRNIFAPMSGYIKLKHDQGGYGLHIRIRDTKKETLLGHLSKVFVTDGQYIHIGDKVGVMGNTGFSTATHLHYALRFLEKGGKLWEQRVLNYDNGYNGWVDPLQYTVTWKGSLSVPTLT